MIEPNHCGSPRIPENCILVVKDFRFFVTRFEGEGWLIVCCAFLLSELLVVHRAAAKKGESKSRSKSCSGSGSSGSSRSNSNNNSSSTTTRNKSKNNADEGKGR